MNKGSMRMLIMSTLYVLLACFFFSVSTYAWFIITNTVKTSLVSSISEVEAEYDFYVYKDSWHRGNTEQTLFNQLCETSSDEGCYQLIKDPSQMFLWTQSVAPGERFSFAIAIVSIGTQAYLSLDIGKVTSEGHLDDDLMIKYSFYYEVTKVSYYVNGTESIDQKNVDPMKPYQGHFNQHDWTIYPLVHDISLNHIRNETVVIVVYFDFYYDPNVIYLDQEGLPFTDHNHLMGQSLFIQDIYMMISTSLN